MKLGLSLAGGGIKGAAHIGVLKAFKEKNIKIDYISGTSSGSIVSTLYAVGYTPEEIYHIFKKYCKEINYVSLGNILKLALGLIFKGEIVIQGLNNGNKIEELMRKLCKAKGITNINQVQMPLLMPSVDLQNGKVYIFSSKKSKNLNNDKIIYTNDMDIAKAVRASCSYPGIFSPCKYNNRELIDGGIRENVPWKETKLMGADKVISVVFEEKTKECEFLNIIEIVNTSIKLLSQELADYEMYGADEVITIKSKHISLLDSSKIDYLYKLSYKIAIDTIEKKNLINN